MVSSTHTISLFVENVPGVLVRVAGLFVRRGFNIESIAAGPTEHPEYTRITIVLRLEDKSVEQVLKQVRKLLPVMEAVELPDNDRVDRELMLIRASLPPVVVRTRCTRSRSGSRRSVLDIFGQSSFLLERTAGPEELDRLIEVLQPLGIQEMARSGRVALQRSHARSPVQQRSFPYRRSTFRRVDAAASSRWRSIGRAFMSPWHLHPTRSLIFDTTLRDGEQCLGASMNTRREAGDRLRARRHSGSTSSRPATLPRRQATSIPSCPWHAMSRARSSVGSPAVVRADIDRDLGGGSRRCPPGAIHVFLATSAIHREHKAPDGQGGDHQGYIRENVRYARDYTEEVEFFAGGRQPDRARLPGGVRRRAGHRVRSDDHQHPRYGRLHTPPSAFAEVFAHLKQDRARQSTRGRSRSTAITTWAVAVRVLAAISAGARQVECAINGIGERAGNCALEEIVMALKTRRDVFKLDTNIDTKRLYPTSRLVSNITGLRVQRNKAIVGQNAFAHEAGIHQHGMLMHRETYEIMQPEEVGYTQSDLILGKHSGRHAVRHRIKELGYHLDEVQLNRVFDEFKILADKKKELYDGDIEALVRGEMWSAPASTCISSSSTRAPGRENPPTAAVSA